MRTGLGSLLYNNKVSSGKLASRFFFPWKTEKCHLNIYTHVCLLDQRFEKSDLLLQAKRLELAFFTPASIRKILLPPPPRFGGKNLNALSIKCFVQELAQVFLCKIRYVFPLYLELDYPILKIIICVLGVVCVCVCVCVETQSCIICGCQLVTCLEEIKSGNLILEKVTYVLDLLSPVGGKIKSLTKWYETCWPEWLVSHI